jgi:response regulator of citrate/malate metabolism
MEEYINYLESDTRNILYITEIQRFLYLENGLFNIGIKPMKKETFKKHLKEYITKGYTIRKERLSSTR